MAALGLVPLSTTEADPYWRVFVDGRTDVPTRSVEAHMERYLALPPEERRAYFAFVEGGRVVGTVRLLPGVLAGFAMAPSHRGRAAEAVVKAVDALRARGADAILATYEDSYQEAFESLGFRRAFARIRMEAPASTPRPRGATLKPPEEGEIPGLAACLMDAYEGHLEQGYGLHVGSESDWRGYVAGLLRGDSGRFMPEASFVVPEQGRIAAVILLTHWMGTPLVAELAVVRDRQRQGLGRALLRAATRRLADLGEPRIALYATVGNEPALRLYASEGFTRVGGATVTARLEA